MSLNSIKETLKNICFCVIWFLVLYQEHILATPAVFSSHNAPDMFTDQPLRMAPYPRYYGSHTRSTIPPLHTDDMKYNHPWQNDNIQHQKTSQPPHRGSLHTFKSSICYDTNGKANIGLKCPGRYEIQTVVAFTALSRSVACSYDSWDCILQEGVTQRCDGRNQCSIAAIYEESIETRMSCGHSTDTEASADKSMYFQVEYECITDNGTKAVASQPETSTTFILLNLEDVVKMDDSFEQDFNDTESAVDDKTALVAILGGTTLGLIILIAVISSCIYRLKNRATKLEGTRSSRITSGVSTMSEGIHTDPELMRQPRRNFQYDYRRQLDRPQQFGRGFTIWNGRSTTYVENEDER